MRYAIEQHTEELLIQRWITNYERDMSFNDFKTKLGIKTTEIVNVQNTKEVLNDVNDIIQMFL